MPKPKSNVLNDEYWTREDLARISEQARLTILKIARLARCCQYLERSSSNGDPQAPIVLRSLHDALENCLQLTKGYEP